MVIATARLPAIVLQLPDISTFFLFVDFFFFFKKGSANQPARQTKKKNN